MVSLKLIFLIDNIEYRVSKTQNNKKKRNMFERISYNAQVSYWKKKKKNMTIKL